MSMDIKPHAYDPDLTPELFEGVLARRIMAFLIDFLVIAAPVVLAAMFIFAFGIVTLGGCDLAVREAIAELAKKGIKADYMRICGFPFAKSVETFLNQHSVNFVVEQNRDAQLTSLLTLETGVKKEKLKPILFYGGFPLSASQVVDAIEASGETIAIDSETYCDAPEFTTE